MKQELHPTKTYRSEALGCTSPIINKLLALDFNPSWILNNPMNLLPHKG